MAGSNRLIITRGLPGSGKTTKARAWVEEDRKGRVRVNRDDIRQMLDDGTFVKGITEPRVIMARDALIIGALKRGLDVICDDTNLPQRVARDLCKLAHIVGARFQVWDLTDVPVETCIERDAARERSVGEALINNMHRQYIRGKELPLPMPTAEEIPAADLRGKYTPSGDLQKAWIVDIDGTVALKGTRDAFDETRVHEDRPNEPVIQLVKSLYAGGYEIIFMSGRTAGCFNETKAWLEKQFPGLPFNGPFMRAEGDNRKDWRVKLDRFWEVVAPRWDVQGTLDDRNQVVNMWRDVLGLTCAQVAPGNF